MNPWLLNEILTGLQKLALLSLDRTPAAEVLPGTARAWLEAITHERTWDEERDRPRFNAAFVTLARTVDRWPAPKQLLDAMPRPDDQLKLARPECDPEVAQAHIDNIREMLRQSGVRDANDPDDRARAFCGEEQQP